MLLFGTGTFFSTTQPTAALKCPDPSFCDVTMWPPHPALNCLDQWETFLCVQEVFIGLLLYQTLPKVKQSLQSTNEENVLRSSNQSKPAVVPTFPSLVQLAPISLASWLAPWEGDGFKRCPPPRPKCIFKLKDPSCLTTKETGLSSFTLSDAKAVAGVLKVGVKVKIGFKMYIHTNETGKNVSTNTSIYTNMKPTEGNPFRPNSVRPQKHTK